MGSIFDTAGYFTALLSVSYISLVAWVIVASAYLSRGKLSSPPGALIASQALCNAVALLVNETALLLQFVALGVEGFELSALCCELAIDLVLYTRTLCQCFDLCVSIELAYKVIRPTAKSYYVSLVRHHVACQVVTLSYLISMFFTSTYSWSDEYGCEYTPSSAFL